MDPRFPSTGCAAGRNPPRWVPGWSRLGVAAIAVAGALGLGSSLVAVRAGGRPTEAQAAARADQAKVKAERVIVPFEMLPTNHMVVRARINGEGPYRLIFDLGAPITLLSNRVSEATGVVKADAPRSFLLGMRGE